MTDLTPTKAANRLRGLLFTDYLDGNNELKEMVQEIVAYLDGLNKETEVIVARYGENHNLFEGEALVLFDLLHKQEYAPLVDPGKYITHSVIEGDRQAGSIRAILRRVE